MYHDYSIFKEMYQYFLFFIIAFFFKLIIFISAFSIKCQIYIITNIILTYVYIFIILGTNCAIQYSYKEQISQLFTKYHL